MEAAPRLYETHLLVCCSVVPVVPAVVPPLVSVVVVVVAVPLPTEVPVEEVAVVQGGDPNGDG